MRDKPKRGGRRQGKFYEKNKVEKSENVDEFQKCIILRGSIPGKKVKNMSMKSQG